LDKCLNNNVNIEVGGGGNFVLTFDLKKNVEARDIGHCEVD